MESHSNEERVISTPSSIEVLDNSNSNNTDVSSNVSVDGENMAAEETAMLMQSSGESATVMHSSGTTMQESSSSGSLINSVINLNTSSGSLVNSGTNPNLKNTSYGRSDTEGSVPTSPAKKDSDRSSSTPTSPTKKDNDRSSEDGSVYHSCPEQDPDSVDGVRVVETCATPERDHRRSQTESLSSTPQTVRSRTNSMNSSTPISNNSAPKFNKFLRSNSDVASVRSLKFHTPDTSFNISAQHEQGGSPEEREDLQSSKPFREKTGPIIWSYDDFSQVDHRIRLFCEINLFHLPDEELLVMAKGEIMVKSIHLLVPGLIVLSNKKIYILKAEQPETEEPCDWLEQLTSAPVSRLQRIIRLLGGQGAALELAGSDNKPTSGLYFSRMSSAGYHGLGGEDCYYVITADSGRTQSLIQQTIDILQERVRSNPIPVVNELNQDEQALLLKQIQVDLSDDEEKLFSFQLALDDRGAVVSVICAGRELVVTTNFFSWVLLDKSTSLQVQARIPVNEVNQLDIYQCMPESCTLTTEKEARHFTFKSEKGLQMFIRSFRACWERVSGEQLESITGFHPTGAANVLKMTALMEESVSFKDFDFSEWIKVTSSKYSH